MNNKKKITYPIDESRGYTCIYRKQEYPFATREEALKFLHAHHGTIMVSHIKKEED